jgi:hypothetical protein
MEQRNLIPVINNLGFGFPIIGSIVFSICKYNINSLDNQRPMMIISKNDDKAQKTLRNLG